MTTIPSSSHVELLRQRVPRYASYPTASWFDHGVTAECQDRWLGSVSSGARVALHVHVPFCPRLCWFCACRTQIAKGEAALEAYVDAVIRESGRIAERLPAGVRASRVHWRGGSPAVLPAALIRRLAERLRADVPFDDDAEFCVELDTVSGGQDRIEALMRAGMTRARLGVQDFGAETVAAIGSGQARDGFRDLVGRLRVAGVPAIEVGLLFGLPRQTLSSLGDTCAEVLDAMPDRLSLSGYVHAPRIAKRQQMIPEEMLPDMGERLAQKTLAARLLVEAGYVRVGVDLFVRPDDPLAEARAAGRLRRCLDGYTDDPVDAVIGLGASSISRFRQGYVQNPISTTRYREGADAGGTRAGLVLSLDDRVRARAIEMLMCDFALDLRLLGAEFGDFASIAAKGMDEAARAFPDHVRLSEARLEIVSEGPLLARLVSRFFDVHADETRSCGQAV